MAVKGPEHGSQHPRLTPARTRVQRERRQTEVDEAHALLAEPFHGPGHDRVEDPLVEPGARSLAHGDAATGGGVERCAQGLLRAPGETPAPQLDGGLDAELGGVEPVAGRERAGEALAHLDEARSRVGAEERVDKRAATPRSADRVGQGEGRAPLGPVGDEAGPGQIEIAHARRQQRSRHGVPAEGAHELAPLVRREALPRAGRGQGARRGVRAGRILVGRHPLGLRQPPPSFDRVAHPRTPESPDPVEIDRSVSRRFRLAFRP